MRRLLAFLRARADNVAAALLAAMFVTFIIQIVARYALLRLFPSIDIGWTLELCLTLWLWVVLWGSAFCLEDHDHVRFDILYQSASLPVRRVLAVAAAIIIVIALAKALPATIDYITFYKIKKSAVLKIRLDYVFSIYGVFAVAIIIRYSWRALSVLMGRSPDAASEGHDTLIEGEEAHRP
jgi:C4-dicarboxylate transporter, DctQ subunit